MCFEPAWCVALVQFHISWLIFFILRLSCTRSSLSHREQVWYIFFGKLYRSSSVLIMDSHHCSAQSFFFQSDIVYCWLEYNSIKFSSKHTIFIRKNAFRDDGDKMPIILSQPWYVDKRFSYMTSDGRQHSHQPQTRSKTRAQGDTQYVKPVLFISEVHSIPHWKHDSVYVTHPTAWLVQAVVGSGQYINIHSIIPPPRFIDVARGKGGWGGGHIRFTLSNPSVCPSVCGRNNIRFLSSTIFPGLSLFHTS